MLHGRRDTTHSEVKKELLALGASVVDLADVGGGVPDLLVGFCGCAFLVEVKSKDGKLRPGQVDFASTWRGGKVEVLRSRESAREWYLRTRGELCRDGAA
jgi:hypothetical protein